MELVSVIIPAFNAARYLRETVDSALRQTYNECEIIVVDDGSTDETPRILAEYGTRLRVVSQTNRGSASACNAGAAIARGKWIAFLDADDVWLPEKLTRQIEHCGDKAISHTDTVCFGEPIPVELRRSSFEPPYSGHVLKELLVRNFITKSTVMISRDAFRQAAGFDETYTGVEDWPFWLKVCADHELGYLPEPLVRYRMHRNSMSMKGRRTLVDHLRIIDEAFGPAGVGKSFPHLRKRALASSYQINCHFSAQSGDWTFALHCALRGLLYDATDLYTWKSLIKAALIPLGVQY